MPFRSRDPNGLPQACTTVSSHQSALGVRQDLSDRLEDCEGAVACELSD